MTEWRQRPGDAGENQQNLHGVTKREPSLLTGKTSNSLWSRLDEVGLYTSDAECASMATTTAVKQIYHYVYIYINPCESFLYNR